MIFFILFLELFLSLLFFSFLPCSPKYVHLINQQYYDDDNEGKESAYDLSTSASSSNTTNPVTASHPSSVLSRLIQDDNIAKNHIQDTHERLNGLGSSSTKKINKHSPLPHSFTNSSNLVTVMMDEKNHDSDEHSFYMPMRRDENGHNADYDEGKPSKKKKSYCIFFYFHSCLTLKFVTCFFIFSFCSARFPFVILPA